jgi:phosphoribosylformimino-5-aminoimidazole carboxamide ribotide isomerase
MELIPAIDIRGGKCVQLVQGDYERETVYGVDPVAMAMHWASQGATRLHVVDLDAARDGRPVNDAVMRRIVAAIDIPVQVAGGVRDHSAIHRWAEAGVDRIIIGTLAVESPAEVERAMTKHRDKISIAVDARGGMAAVKGWLETSNTPVETFVRRMAGIGARYFIYTDISRDGMLGHPDFAAVPAIVELVASSAEREPDAPVPLVYSGGVTSVEDVESLAQHELEGVIIGTALYDGRIDLRAAQRALSVGDDW